MDDREPRSRRCVLRHGSSAPQILTPPRAQGAHPKQLRSASIGAEASALSVWRRVASPLCPGTVRALTRNPSRTMARLQDARGRVEVDVDARRRFGDEAFSVVGGASSSPLAALKGTTSVAVAGPVSSIRRLSSQRCCRDSRCTEPTPGSGNGLLEGFI